VVYNEKASEMASTFVDLVGEVIGRLHAIELGPNQRAPDGMVSDVQRVRMLALAQSGSSDSGEATTSSGEERPAISPFEFAVRQGHQDSPKLARELAQLLHKLLQHLLFLQPSAARERGSSVSSSGSESDMRFRSGSNSSSTTPSDRPDGVASRARNDTTSSVTSEEHRTSSVELTPQTRIHLQTVKRLEVLVGQAHQLARPVPMPGHPHLRWTSLEQAAFKGTYSVVYNEEACTLAQHTGQVMEGLLLHLRKAKALSDARRCLLSEAVKLAIPLVGGVV
jgi:hypothetical protein